VKKHPKCRKYALILGATSLNSTKGWRSAELLPGPVRKKQ